MSQHRRGECSFGAVWSHLAPQRPPEAFQTLFWQILDPFWYPSSVIFHVFHNCWYLVMAFFYAAVASFCRFLAFNRFAFKWPVSKGCGGIAPRQQSALWAPIFNHKVSKWYTGHPPEHTLGRPRAPRPPKNTSGSIFIVFL